MARDDLDMNDLKGSSKRARAMRLVPLLFVGLGTIFGCLGLYKSIEMAAFMKKADWAQGEVIGHQVKKSDDGVTYTSIVRFQDEYGRVHEFADWFSTNPKMEDVGDVVSVAYMPDGSETARIDRGVWNFFISGIFLVLGAIFMFVGQVVGKRSAARLFKTSEGEW